MSDTNTFIFYEMPDRYCITVTGVWRFRDPLRETLKEWCEEHLGPEGERWSWIDTGAKVGLAFRREEDRLLFYMAHSDGT